MCVLGPAVDRRREETEGSVNEVSGCHVRVRAIVITTDGRLVRQATPFDV